MEITQSTIEAVDRVLAGEDESQGALYFMARSGSDASSIGWFEANLTPLMVHGGHESVSYTHLLAGNLNSQAEEQLLRRQNPYILTHYLHQ